MSYSVSLKIPHPYGKLLVKVFVTYNCGRALFSCCIKKLDMCIPAQKMLPGMTALTYRVFFFSFRFNCSNGLLASSRRLNDVSVNANSIVWSLIKLPARIDHRADLSS